MKRKISFLLSVLIIFSSFFCGCNNNNSYPNKQEEASQSDSVRLGTIIEKELITVYVDNILMKYGFCGTMLISKDNTILYEKSMGYQNPENFTLNTNDTHYQIGSLTKQMTGAAILQLESKGRLSTNDTLDKYFDGYDYLESIRISDLLDMTAHFTDYIKFAEDKEVVNKVTELIKSNDEKKIKQFITSLILEDGVDESDKDFSYNNSCYYLLGIIIEKASQMSYRDYIARYIFTPANMTESGFCGDGLDAACGYKNNIKGEFISDTAEYGNVFVYPFMLSAGSVVSTASDINRWLCSFWNGKIVDSKSLDKLFKSDKKYVCGWFKDKSSFYHMGNTNSYTAIDFVVPSKKISVTILTNIGMYSDIEKLVKELCNAVFETEFK